MTEATLVFVRGKGYQWSQENGLDPEAVLAIEGWVKKLAGRFRRKAETLNIGFDDLVQTGYVAALGAAKSFDPSRGKTFLSWASWKIISDFRDLCRRQASYSLDEPGGEGLDTKAMNLPDPDDRAARTEATADARRMLGMLNRGERRLLSLAFGIGRGESPMKAAMLARGLGASRTTVNARIRKALCSIRRKVNK